MYQLPITLNSDIERFGALASDYRQKKIDSVQFKAFRVPMGVYEQRQDEVYMSRVRATGGVIYPDQFLALIAIARKYKSDLLHITTRQEIQVQNLDLNNVEPVLSELQTVGLATKGGGGNTVRNIIVSEGSGISPEEVFDTTPYAMALTTKLIAESDSYLLPRKLKIAFSSDDKEIGYAAINDLGFVAKEKDGERGFQVYVGGGAGSRPTVGWILFDFVPVADLYALAEALKKFFSEHGNRKNRHKARLRFIFYQLGEAETLRLIKEYFAEAKKTQPLLLLPDEVKDAEYSFKSTGISESDDFFLWKKRYVTPQKQPHLNTVLIPFLWGNISLTDEKTVSGLQKLLHFIHPFGKHAIRFTTSQNIRLRNIPTEALPELYSILKQFIADTNAPLLLNNIISCTGADTCRLGIGLSKGLAAAIRRKLQSSKLSLDKLADVRIHISGCPNSCGQQLWADIGFSGKVLRNNRAYPGYQVYLSANRNDKPKFAEVVGNISARDIPEFLQKLLQAYLDIESEHQSFTDFLQKKGREIALQLLEEYKEIPDFADDKNYYFDWGAETIFSVVGRGTPECSAGLFDMIEVDIKSITGYIKELETETNLTKANGILYRIIYSSSRMLLVTRGLEAKQTNDVFDLFITHFIESGIVNEKFKNILTTARDNKNHDFTLHKGEIYELAETVTDLYKNMDDSLQFKNVKAKETPAGTSTGRFKDLRGVACPMNFVQTKIELSTLQSGEKLEIWLDDGAPINNVPGSVKNEGHEVLEQTQLSDYWKVIIKKK
jgi:sulfite reductase (ferredoxin)